MTHHDTVMTRRKPWVNAGLPGPCVAITVWTCRHRPTIQHTVGHCLLVWHLTVNRLKNKFLICQPLSRNDTHNVAGEISWVNIGLSWSLYQHENVRISKQRTNKQAGETQAIPGHQGKQQQESHDCMVVNCLTQ